MGLLDALGAILATIAWLVPNHYPPWTSFYNDAAMLLGLAAVVCATFLVGPVPGAPRSAWAVVAVAAIPPLQWATGVLHYSGDAWVGAAYLLAAGVAIHAGYGAHEGGRDGLALPLSGAALAAAAISGSLAIALAFGSGSFGIWTEYVDSGMRAVGNLAQPNNFATLLGFGAVGAFYLFERGKLTATVTLFAIVLLIVAGALTQSRISVFFGLVFTAALWLFRRRGIPFRTPLGVAGALTLVHWLLLLLMPVLLLHWFQNAPETMAVRGLQTPRYQMWRMLLEAVWLVPWQGYGWLQVGAAELAIVDRHAPIGELWLQGHNVFVELVVWCGWPLGVTLAAGLLFWYVSRLVRVRNRNAAFGMLTISVLGVHALVEFPHHYAYFLVPAALWAGIVEREEDAPTGGRGAWMIVPAALALTIFVGIARDYLAIEDDFRRVRFENSRLAREASQTVRAPWMSSLTGFLDFARIQPKRDMSEAQLRTMRASVERYPYAASLARYGSALALNGRLAEGTSTYLKIRYIYGDKIYARITNDLRDRAETDEPELAELARSLPLFSEGIAQRQ